MTRHLSLRWASLPALALLAACSEPPAPVTAQRPEEAFRAACQQRLPNASTFGLEKCMADEYDLSRGVTPASATPSPAPAAPAASSPSRSTPRSTARRGR